MKKSLDLFAKPSAMVVKPKGLETTRLLWLREQC
jgi:hypothetical protein